MSDIYLPPPSKKRKVANALNYIYDGSENEHRTRSNYWQFIRSYIQGHRNYNRRRLGLVGSTPTSTHTDRSGRRRVRAEMAFVQGQTEIGRLLGIDTSPVVQRTPGVGLDRYREESLSQATLSEIHQQIWTAEKRLTFTFNTVMYGTLGLAVTQPPYFSQTWLPRATLIVPWELRPIPSEITDLSQLGGITWARYVPVEWLKMVLKGTKTRYKAPKNSAVLERPYGTHPQIDGAPTDLYGGGDGLVAITGKDWESRAGQGPDIDDLHTEFVLLKEHWLFGDGDSVTRYVRQIDREEPLVDVDYTSDEWQSKLPSHMQGELPTRPVSMARYNECGSFWARGFMERQIPLNLDMEEILGDVIDNARRMDRLTMMAIPTTLGMNERRFAQAVKNGYMTYQPDPSATGTYRPEVISPANSGTGLQNVVGMLTQLQGQLSAQGELVYGGVEGRLESAKALAVVGQYQNVPLAAVGESIEGCMSSFWKACLGYVRQTNGLAKANGLKLRHMDEMALGLVVDPQSGEITVSSDMLPHPSSLHVTIRSKEPRNKELIYNQLKEMYQLKLISETELFIALFREGLDFPCPVKEPYNHYTNAWYETIVLFGDGQTPGQVPYHPEWENHVIHYLVHSELTSLSIFKYASPAVQNAVQEHRAYHQSQLGQLPEGMPAVGDMGQPVPPNPDMLAAVGQPPPAGMGPGLDIQ